MDLPVELHGIVVSWMELLHAFMRGEHIRYREKQSTLEKPLDNAF